MVVAVIAAALVAIIGVEVMRLLMAPVVDMWAKQQLVGMMVLYKRYIFYLKKPIIYKINCIYFYSWWISGCVLVTKKKEKSLWLK